MFPQFLKGIWTISHPLGWLLSQKKEGGEGCRERLEHFCTVEFGNVKWYNHYGKQVGSSLKIKSRITT